MNMGAHGFRSLATLIVGGYLFYAGLTKALSPSDTLSSLSWAFGEAWATPVFVLLVVTEIVLASLLLCDVAPRWCSAAAVVLFCAFIAWILYLQWNNAPVGCGCGGGLPSPVETSPATGRFWSGIRSALLLFCSLIGALGYGFPRRSAVRCSHTEGDST